MFKTIAKREVVNLDDMCRLCLVETDDLVGIFVNDENCSLSIRIMACSALEVQQNDALPKSICIECRQLLEKFYYFRKKSKISDSKLRRHLRLINAGKVSQVFNASDDEDEDDDIESRRLFERWESEKQAQDKRAEELQKQLAAKALRRAIEEERVKLRSVESVRIAAELRTKLEPGIREELHEKLEPLMRDQIAKQIELSVNEKQVEEIRREVQKALKGKQEEMMNEFRKIQSLQGDKSKAESEADIETVQVYVQDDPFEDDPQTESMLTDEEMIFGEYEVLYEEKADRTMPRKTATKAQTAIETTYTSMTEDDEADGDEHFRDEETERSATYELDDGDHDVGVKENDDDADKTNDEELFIIGDTLSEYLEEEEDPDDTTMTLDEEPDPDEEQVDDETDEVMNESLRKAIGNYTGRQLDYTYKIKNIRDPKMSSVEVKTVDGVLVVQMDNQSQAEDLDENGELKIFPCAQCPQAFARRFQLSRHMSTHDKRRGHMCEICEKWFPSKSSLSRHGRTHTGEKPFKCGVCDRSFIQKEILRRHEVTHTGEKPFACEHCPKKFTQREVLRQHINRHHTESPVIDLHKCPKCPKSFFHASGLSRHILVHSGRKFHCEHCYKPFSDKSALKRHVGALHPDASLVGV